MVVGEPCKVPDAQVSVTGGRDGQAAVRSYSDRVDLYASKLNHPVRRPCREFPNSHSPVVGARQGQTAVGGDRHGANRARVALQRVSRGAARKVPDAQGSGCSRPRRQAAVRSDGDRMDWASPTLKPGAKCAAR